MAARRSALDRLATSPPPRSEPFDDIKVEATDRLGSDGRPGAGMERLAAAVAARLMRSGERPGPGAALVTGLSALADLDGARAFHERLFRRVWAEFRPRAAIPGADADFRVKTGTITDGSIPLERYGSRWSFKDLHIDREVLLFSHLYGPVRGFTGGELLLVDAWAYMAKRGLRFDDAFQWSEEATAGSKPVLRAAHCDRALAEFGVNLGPLRSGEILFVNNLPDAGVLHGATPVTVTDPGGFRREYHRCSVKDVAGNA